MILNILGFRFEVASEEEREFIREETAGKSESLVQQILGLWITACAETELYPNDDDDGTEVQGNGE
jgi:hypothetical protein